jgi:hypothetical protein
MPLKHFRGIKKLGLEFVLISKPNQKHLKVPVSLSYSTKLLTNPCIYQQLGAHVLQE